MPEAERLPKMNGLLNKDRQKAGLLSWLLLECRKRHQFREEISIECCGGALKLLERFFVSGHSHPADCGPLEQAARNLERVGHLGAALRISLGSLDPDAVVPKLVGTEDRLAEIEDSPWS